MPDYALEPADSCSVCDETHDCYSIYTGTVQLTNLCRRHAREFAEWLTRQLS